MSFLFTEPVKINLIENYPRSPREKLNGLVHIPRMIDKANASRDKVLGEYIFPCPMDKIMLNFLGLSDQEFINKIYKRKDREIAEWLSGVIATKQLKDIDFINEQILNPKRIWWKQIYGLALALLNPFKKKFNTWVDRVDYEEGRSN